MSSPPKTMRSQDGWRCATAPGLPTTQALLRSLLLATILCAPPALAGPDAYGLGTGKDGTLTVTTANSQINFYSLLTAPAAPGDSTLVVSSTASFSAGDLVLVLQMTGIVPEPPSGGPSPIDITNDPVGRWELARLTAVTAASMTLDVPLVNSYAGNVTQVIRVREYTTVSISSPGFITAPAWNGSTGGVVAFLANGTLTINSFPAINVTGKGFRGGQTVDDPSGSTGCTELDEAVPAGAQKGEGIAFMRFQPPQATGRGRVANGGGGGVCLNSGGGGGGNGGAGGQGGNSDLDTDGNRAVGGQGGAALSFGMLDHMMMGGGGGAGHVTNGTGAAGGAGGGIIFVRTSALVGAGTLVANGAAGGNAAGQDAASGGGAGGSIYLRVAGAAACGSLQVVGGNGGSANAGLAVGPGGAGGGGRLLLQKGSGTCTPTTSSVNPGSPGMQADSSAPGGWAYGAQAGTAGSSSVLSGGFPLLSAVVATPAATSFTNDATPTYTGTLASPIPTGTEVVIYVDGAKLGRVTPDAMGNWSFSQPTELSETIHTVHAVAINTAQGVQGSSSNLNSFTVDTLPPAPPALLTPASDSVIKDILTIYGAAEAGSKVAVSLDGTELETITADAAGTWVLVATAPAEGSHQVAATARDLAGNVSLSSETHSFTVDRTKPRAPEVTAPGGLVNAQKPIIVGTAEAGSTVTVSLDGAAVATTMANPSGDWAAIPTQALGEGTYHITATARDAAGNVSPPSEARGFTVDLTKPGTPEVIAPGELINSKTPTLVGTAEAGSTVTVLLDGVEAGQVMSAGGSWAYTTVALVEGLHQVTVTARDAAGNVSPPSVVRGFTVDTRPPAAPEVSAPEGFVNDTSPDIGGTAEAGSRVTVLVNGVEAGRAMAGEGGDWTFTATVPSEGVYSVTAIAMDAAGNVSPASPNHGFTLDLTKPGAPEVSEPGGFVNTPKPVIRGTAEAGSTVTVLLDGEKVGTPKADDAMIWVYSPVKDLPEGLHHVTAIAMDAAGNVSPASEDHSFTVDITPPEAPEVSEPGDFVKDSKPVIRGTAEAGSTVTVWLDGEKVGTPEANAGVWTFTPTAGLDEGLHRVIATAQDAAKNTSPSSDEHRFIVQKSHYGWSCTTSPTSPATWAVLALIWSLGRRCRARGWRAYGQRVLRRR